MPQSLASILIHLVFSTKGRTPSIAEAIQHELHAYLASILQRLDSPALVINGTADHVHLLFCLATRIGGVGGRGSQEAILKVDPNEGRLRVRVQAGYGAFSVSQSKVDDVRRYIAAQREHHRTRSFEDEFRELLKRHRVDFDERFVWE